MLSKLAIQIKPNFGWYIAPNFSKKFYSVLYGNDHMTFFLMYHLCILQLWKRSLILWAQWKVETECAGVKCRDFVVDPWRRCHWNYKHQHNIKRRDKEDFYIVLSGSIRIHDLDRELPLTIQIIFIIYNQSRFFLFNWVCTFPKVSN